MVNIASSTRPRIHRSSASRVLALALLGIMATLSQTLLGFATIPLCPRLLSTKLLRSVRGIGLVRRNAYGDDLSAFESVSPDEWQTGVVQNIASFGAFVKVTLPDGSQADGLVHISQIRDGFVERVDDELERGQEVKVRVINVDTSAGKMGLSMKESGGGGGGGGGPRAPQDLSPFEELTDEQWLDGKVARTTSFGAFVTVTAPDGETQADGLVHITQIREGFVESVDEELSEGQEVKVRVKSVEDGKMGLTMLPIGEGEDGS